MVKTLKDKDIPEPWFAKKTNQVTITRAASKHMAQHEVVEDDLLDQPSAKGEAREKGKSKEDVPGKGRKKVKAMRPATAEVVMGRSKYVVPDPEEMRRKMVADAEACGRVVKSVSTPAHRKSCPSIPVADQSDDRLQPELVRGAQFGSPVPEMAPAEEGMDAQTQEGGNAIADDIRITPSGQRSGKEVVNEEIEQSPERAPGKQERGKRKATGNAVRISSSSERSDPAQSAQKYRRLNRSPSPIILTERVSWLLPSVTAVFKTC